MIFKFTIKINSLIQNFVNLNKFLLCIDLNISSSTLVVNVGLRGYKD